MKNSAKNNLFCVYVHISPNQKRYYGITSRSVYKRWGKGNGYRKNKHFYNAIQKYGWDNFKHEIIAENLSLEDACEIEKEMISIYNTNNPQFGYNHTGGGEANIEISEETRLKMSKAAKRHGFPPKLLEYLKNMPPKEGTRVCYDGKTFISISSCAKYMGIDRRMVGSYLKGVDSMPEEYKDKGLSYEGIAHTYILSDKAQCRKVRYKGVLYPSLNALDRALGVRKDTISEILNNRMKPPQWLDINDLELVENKRYYYKILDERNGKGYGRS